MGFTTKWMWLVQIYVGMSGTETLALKLRVFRTKKKILSKKWFSREVIEKVIEVGWGLKLCSALDEAKAVIFV